jgi:hypothetical protein
MNYSELQQAVNDIIQDDSVALNVPDYVNEAVQQIAAGKARVHLMVNVGP